jgi:hypothetical protein
VHVVGATLDSNLSTRPAPVSKGLKTSSPNRIKTNAKVKPRRRRALSSHMVILVHPRRRLLSTIRIRLGFGERRCQLVAFVATGCCRSVDGLRETLLTDHCAHLSLPREQCMNVKVASRAERSRRRVGRATQSRVQATNRIGLPLTTHHSPLWWPSASARDRTERY